MKGPTTGRARAAGKPEKHRSLPKNFAFGMTVIRKREDLASQLRRAAERASRS